MLPRRPAPGRRRGGRPRCRLRRASAAGAPGVPGGPSGPSPSRAATSAASGRGRGRTGSSCSPLRRSRARTRDQHGQAGARGQQAPHLRPGRAQMLEPVQDEQQALRAEVGGQGGAGRRRGAGRRPAGAPGATRAPEVGPPGAGAARAGPPEAGQADGPHHAAPPAAPRAVAGAQAEGGGDRRQDLGRRVDLLQGDEDDPLREAGGAGGRLERQPGLARAARAGEGHQTHVLPVQALPQGGQLPLPSDERRRRRRGQGERSPAGPRRGRRPAPAPALDFAAPGGAGLAPAGAVRSLHHPPG